jgi:hypothetical protein
VFVAESEMVAVEKGLQEKAASMTPIKVAGVFKDVMNRLDAAVNFFEDALTRLTSSARSDFLTYYVTYCKAMRTYYEVGFETMKVGALLVPLFTLLPGRTTQIEARMS